MRYGFKAGATRGVILRGVFRLVRLEEPRAMEYR